MHVVCGREIELGTPWTAQLAVNVAISTISGMAE